MNTTFKAVSHPSQRFLQALVQRLPLDGTLVAPEKPFTLARRTATLTLYAGIAQRCPSMVETALNAGACPNTRFNRVALPVLMDGMVPTPLGLAVWIGQHTRLEHLDAGDDESGASREDPASPPFDARATPVPNPRTERLIQRCAATSHVVRHLLAWGALPLVEMLAHASPNDHRAVELALLDRLAQGQAEPGMVVTPALRAHHEHGRHHRGYFPDVPVSLPLWSHVAIAAQHIQALQGWFKLNGVVGVLGQAGTVAQLWERWCDNESDAARARWLDLLNVVRSPLLGEPDAHIYRHEVVQAVRTLQRYHAQDPAWNGTAQTGQTWLQALIKERPLESFTLGPCEGPLRAFERASIQQGLIQLEQAWLHHKLLDPAAPSTLDTPRARPRL